MDLSKASEKEMMEELTRRRNARLSGALYLIERSDGERSLQFNMPGFTSNTRILDQVKVVVGEDSKIKLEPFYPLAAMAQAKADAYVVAHPIATTAQSTGTGAQSIGTDVDRALDEISFLLKGIGNPR